MASQLDLRHKNKNPCRSRSLTVIAAAILIGWVASVACAPATPSPEEYARATVILDRSNATKTLEAVAYAGTATAVFGQAKATATVQPAAIAAAISLTETQSAASNTREWVWLLAFLGFLIIASMLGSGLALWVRTRASYVTRDATGQLPAYFDAQSGVITDTARMIGPALAFPRQSTDRLWHLRRIWNWVRHGQWTDMPEPKIQTTDHDATPEQLLIAAQSAQATAATAALMRPGATAEERKARLGVFENFKRGPTASPAQPPGLPAMRLVLDDPATLGALAEQVRRQEQSQPLSPSAPPLASVPLNPTEVE